jgi:hypothetical protein
MFGLAWPFDYTTRWYDTMKEDYSSLITDCHIPHDDRVVNVLQSDTLCCLLIISSFHTLEFLRSDPI